MPDLRRWTIGRSGDELYVSEGPSLAPDEYVDVMPVAGYEALREAAQRVVDSDQGFRHPRLGVAISDLKDALDA